MQTNILERIRLLESDIEKRRDAVVEQQLLPITNPRHLLMRDRFVAEQQAHLSRTATDLLDLYLDGDDLPAVQEEAMPLEQMLQFFSARVANIREYYRTHEKANGEVEEESIEPDMEALMENGVFAPDEKYGTRLRLQAHFAVYERFCSSCASTRDDAARQLVHKLRVKDERFMFNPTDPLAETPQKLKMLEHAKYYTFVSGLREYLVDFYTRVKPLQVKKLKEQLKLAGTIFDDYWRQVEAAAAAATAAGATSTSSSRFQAAAVPRAHPCLIAPWDLRSIPASITAADDDNVTNNNSSSAATDLRAAARAIALAEAEIAVLVKGPSGIMCDIIRTAAEEAQADHSKMPAEVRREEEDAEEAFLASLEEMDERLRVVKLKAAPRVAGEEFDLDLLTLGPNAAGSSSAANGGGASRGHIISGDGGNAAIADQVDMSADPNAMLLDADGNPLPAWQKKMEGRRLVFTCEICAGAVYRGPKLWGEHFSSYRHTEGLRRLNILNGPSFYGIYTILGAQLIANQLKEAGSQSLLKRIQEEYAWSEIEDESGIVLSRGDYERARRNMMMQQMGMGMY